MLLSSPRGAPARRAASASARRTSRSSPGARPQLEIELRAVRHSEPLARPLVDAARRAGLAHDDLAEPGQRRLRPAPRSSGRGSRWSGSRGLRPRSGSGGRAARSSGLKAASTSAKSMNQPSRSSTSPRTWSATWKECPCSRAHLWSGGDHRQPVRRLERELLEDLHRLADADDLVRLQAEPPLRVLEAVLDGARDVRLERRGRPSAAGRSARSRRRRSARAARRPAGRRA